MSWSFRTTSISASLCRSPYVSQPVAVEFHEINAHTAKCDLCNTRHSSGMSRCDACGWQACYKCLLDNGCDRTHTGNGRVHTGTFDPKDIARQSERRKSGKEGMRNQEEDDREVIMTSRNMKSGSPSGRKDGKESDNSPLSSLRSSPSTYEDDSASEEGLDAARDLLAFSIEAWKLAIQEDACNGSRSTVLAGDDEAVGITRQQLHDYAQRQADLALEEYLHSRVIKEYGPEDTVFTSDSDSRPKGASNSAILPSKAEVFARKSTSGRCGL